MILSKTRKHAFATCIAPLIGGLIRGLVEFGKWLAAFLDEKVVIKFVGGGAVGRTRGIDIGR